ncbi:MAG: SocA family protein [Bacteroidales bacterium]|nr:SocA family protein [Bacteroidales bacterium]MBP5395867.1 SocA family protein [Bacteroidales bacterium]
MIKDTRKIIQALTYLSGKEENKVMDNMKVYKLLWLSDRYHLRQTGMTVTGDAYYAMPYGIVPSDAKCVLENAKTKLLNPKGYKDRYIANKGAHQFMALTDADLKMFSESDLEALDKVYEAFGGMDALQLSELSHHFPEWTFYRDLLNDKEQKNSYRIDLDHFFEKGPEAGFFCESQEMLNLTQELYHQYNRI